jgi:hypothetical protein
VLTLPIAASFLAGAILTLLIPVCLLIAVAIWHGTVIMRADRRGLPPAQPGGTPPPVSDEELPEL